VPPPGLQTSVVVDPWQVVAVPVIDAGVELTVSVAVLVQPALTVYVIVVVPAATPVAMPVPASIVALVVLLLIHVPPVVAWVSAVVAPGHTVSVPDMLASAAFTVAFVTLKQPALTV
jgi:hypothetical protein